MSDRGAADGEPVEGGPTDRDPADGAGGDPAANGTGEDPAADGTGDDPASNRAGDGSPAGDVAATAVAGTAGGTGPADPRELLVDLVSIPSPTGQEAACAERLASYLRAAGREAWIDDAGNVRAPGEDAVLLTSHVDTVPGDLTVEVAPGEDGDPALWGRGSVDATGSLAAMAVAAVRTGASFAGVVGEETDSRGARHLVQHRDAPGAVVNGEPSGWAALTLGYRGFLAGTYERSGPAGHSSRPEPNALQDAMAWWNRVEAEFGGHGADNGDDGGSAGAEGGSGRGTGVFESVTPKPVSMDGGVTDDGLAVEASVDFQLRVPPSLTLGDVRGTVADLAGPGSVAFDDGVAVPPWQADPRSSLAAAFRRSIRAAGGEPTLLRKTGTADANLFAAAWDCPVVTYGPGDAAYDHAPDEHLPLAEYDRAIEVLETVATDLID